MKITVKVPGSCGELIQGTIKGVPFLVTCPVNIYTEVTVVNSEKQELIGLGSKSQLALFRTLEYLGYERFSYRMELQSELPIGKGMASSSADIASVIVATAATFGETLTSAEISRLAAGIEPTDGIFFPGIVRLNHMTGECLEYFDALPEIKIAVFDCGGVINTLEFHKRTDLMTLNQQNEQMVLAALKKIRDEKTASAIAQAATDSALANQTIICKPDLENIVNDVKSLGALGVNAAHSGTVIGVLFACEMADELITEIVSKILIKYPHLQFLRQLKLISGGYDIKIVR